MRREKEDATLFREAVRDARPLKPQDRVVHARPKPLPRPVQREDEEQAVLAGLVRYTLDDDSEFNDEGMFLRPGLPRDILRKLKRTHWRIEANLDLHGLSGDEAVAETAMFLAGCKHSGVRCVRIIHGKGLRNPDREPVLKRRVRKLLTRHDTVLAFVEPRPVHGGGGAVVVLLEA